MVVAHSHDISIIDFRASYRICTEFGYCSIYLYLVLTEEEWASLFWFYLRTLGPLIGFQPITPWSICHYFSCFIAVTHLYEPGQHSSHTMNQSSYGITNTDTVDVTVSFIWILANS